jgi:hypothetical protein
MRRLENWIWIILLAYVAGFLLFPPRVLLTNDEERYVTQAVAFSRGELTVAGANMIDPRSELTANGQPAAARENPMVASDYPPGTSILQTPFVMVGGWRAAAALSVLGLVLLTTFTALLLRAYGLQPAFAVLVPTFLGSLFFGRVAMSDVPTAALVALSLWLLRRAEVRGWPWSFAAGLTSGLCLVFREPVIVLLTPFLVGMFFTRRRAAPALLVGGVLGIALRFALSQAFFGNALYVREPGYGFSWQSLAHNLPQYAPILLVMFPLGAILPFLYRGMYRARIITAFALYTLVFLLFDYNAWRDNGLVKGTILLTRFIIPALPLLVIMAADAYPRLHSRLSDGLKRLVDRALPIACAGIAVLAFAIHPLLRRLDAEPYSIVQSIQRNTALDVPLVINEKVAGKYLSPIYGPRLQISRSTVNAADLPRYCRDYGRLGFVLLDRFDSEMFRRDASDNAEFLSEAKKYLLLREIYKAPHGPGMQLRVLETVRCSQT